MNNCDTCVWATRNGGCASWGCDYIQMQEAAEAWKERKVGKWETEIRTIRGAKIPFYACSECGKNSADEYRYCPNCGADMRGEQK